ncbi:MAG: MarR family winged helix-turn-helix transcriptional regulator [Oliverpabstia sp.]|nr:winged helix DNA-binding protein [Eubacterium sp.]MCI6997176.1 winged helix DNA-binding protein [Eubacterium sp.]
MDTRMEAMLQGGPFKKLLEEQIAELRQKYDMKKAELEILYFLSKCGSHNTSKDIHYQLMMNKGHISQAVDSLCKRHYIIATTDQQDRRYIHYQLSDSAQQIVEEMAKKRLEMDQRIVEGISEEDLEIFRAVSEKIRKNIEKMI